MKKVHFFLLIVLLSPALFAQTELTGTWSTGEQNTLIEIVENDGVLSGEILSSDNPKAIIGKQVLKEIKKDDDEWRGKIFAAKKKKWYGARLTPEEDILKITVKSGFISKTVEWKRVEPVQKETKK
jgi:uncharacterized protein (DUF2147 family)